MSTMTRRARFVSTDQVSERVDLFEEREYRAALFITLLPGAYEAGEVEEARAYVRFGSDANDATFSPTRDFDIVLAPGQSLQAAEAFPELPKGPVTVYITNPEAEEGRALQLVASEFSFRDLPPQYRERQEVVIVNVDGRDGGGSGGNTHWGGRAPGGRRETGRDFDDCAPLFTLNEHGQLVRIQ